MKLSQVYANVELSALFQQAPGGHIIPYGQIWKLQYVYSFIGSNSIPLKLDCIPLMGINYPVLSTNKYSAIFSKAIFNTEFLKPLYFHSDYSETLIFLYCDMLTFSIEFSENVHIIINIFLVLRNTYYYCLTFLITFIFYPKSKFRD